MKINEELNFLSCGDYLCLLISEHYKVAII
jgi:hypothetical protein